MTIIIMWDIVNIKNVYFFIEKLVITHNTER